MVMLNAMQQANSVEPQKYLPYLAKIQVPGITAKKIAYDEYGDLINGAMSIYQVVDHDWRILNVIGTETPKTNHLM
jgi:branched-chain amino acid transport system substrate-binding protein